MAVQRDYSSVYSIKDFAMTEVAPKYFDLDDINLLNIGLMGYVTELVANTAEDSFNAFATYIREIAPNTARIPETLYNRAAALQIDNLFATPAAMSAVLFIKESDITTLGTANSDGIIKFVLDSSLVVNIEGKYFMLDYDVNISAKSYRSDWIYTAAYDFSFTNSLSDLTNPYIKTRRVTQGNVKYLGLIVKLRQISKYEQTQSIINNDKVNLPTLSFTFDDQLAGFEVFYKAPNSDTYEQLQKRMFNSTPVKTPFCYYRIKDDTTVEISFTLRDGYFQPEFNSDIKILYCTTIGSSGVFPYYKGTDITVTAQSETYEYNNQIIVFATPQSDSTGGTDKLTLEELRSVIIERSSTTGAYNNENDLQLYLANLKTDNNSETLFIKQRDDALSRVFSAYSLFRDDNGDIYPTNTLHLNLYPSQFDIEYEQSNRYILKPGHLFRYANSSKDAVEIIPGKTLKDDLSTLTDDFVYTSPFLISVAKSPSVVGFYLNSLSTKIALDYNYVNSDSSVQFICNYLQISRNALAGDSGYTMTMLMLPATDIDMNIVDSSTGANLGNMIVKAVVEDTTGDEICMFNIPLKSYDKSTNIYTFETVLTTDDYITVSEKFEVLNVQDVLTGETITKLIPMVDCKINFYTFYKYSDDKIDHKFDYLEELQPYSLTNIYSTDDNRIDFITPISMIRSRLKFISVDATAGTYYMNLSLLPFVKAATLKDSTTFSNFLSSLYKHYGYLEDILDKITNNFGVDIKFYNTYGKSKNFTIGDDGSILDKVNISISIRLYLYLGVVESDVIARVKAYIKNYIETINSDGYNPIFISNLSQSILNNFSSEISHLKFNKINSYDSSIQTLQNIGTELDSLSKDKRMNYVPEFLTISLSDIGIEIASS